MIRLTEYDVKWIKLCKGHYADLYRTNANNWIETLKPMFREIYAYEPNEHYMDFLDCMFHKLFDIYLKIQDDHSGHNVQLKEIVSAGFAKTFRREYELPIERVIAELCGQIQCNSVFEDGVMRYALNGEDESLCIYYDEAQGRHKCTCKEIVSQKCTGVCTHYKTE